MRIDLTLLLPLAYLLGAIGLDWFAGIAVAVKAGSFQWSKLSQILESTVGPVFGPTALLAIVGAVANASHAGLTPEITAAVITLAASYTPKFVADAQAKWLAFAAGIVVPAKVSA